MAALVCDLCGGKLVMGAGGIATCDSCGMEHSADRMKEKVQEVKGIVQTDSSHLVANYLGMAINALDAGNKKEAEAYCNKIIEVDPTNYRAWMIKGQAAAWQSTLEKSRISEGVNAFAKGIKYAPEEEKESVVEKAKEQIKKLCVAMVTLRAERFAKWHDKEETNALISMLTTILSTVVNFLSQTGVLISISEIMNPVADLINKSAVLAYKNFYPDYKSARYPYPKENDWRNFIERLDFCITVVEKAIDISGDDDEDDIPRYQNLISFHKEAIESCSYDWKYFDYHKGLGDAWVRQLENAVRTDGNIPDVAHDRYYFRSFVLADSAVDYRKRKISEYEAKIREIKAEIARREAAEKAEKERIAREEAQRRLEEYWSEHAEEKEALEAEKENLQTQMDSLDATLVTQIAELNNQIATISGSAELANLDERINKLTSDKNTLGFFKGKEKKVLQEQIDYLTRDKTEIQSRMAAVKKELETKIAAARADVQKKVAPMKSRISAINNELMKAR